MNKISIAVGRCLLGLYFLVPGIQKFTNADDLTVYMQSHGLLMAPQLLWFAGGVSIIGGIFLMCGRHVKFVAYGFVVYVLLVNFMLHDFWTMSEALATREMQNFVKNLGIVAGLLVLAGYSPSRRLSLKGWSKSDKSIQK
jgi:putative oxidoreductase